MEPWFSRERQKLQIATFELCDVLVTKQLKSSSDVLITVQDRDASVLQLASPESEQA